jgi:hypothetical protein
MLVGSFEQANLPKAQDKEWERIEAQQVEGLVLLRQMRLQPKEAQAHLTEMGLQPKEAQAHLTEMGLQPKEVRTHLTGVMAQSLTRQPEPSWKREAGRQH